LELEWAGIPAVHICHESLSGAARAMAIASGMPSYRWLTVDYPYALDGEWALAEVPDLARDLAPRVLDLLMDQPTKRSP
jgi:hypothetical protein